MITKATQKVLDVSGRKPNKVCVDKESEFYQKLTKFWQSNKIENYSTHSKVKLLFAERYIKNLKNEICKYMAVISKSVYIKKNPEIVKEFDNTIRITQNNQFEVS